MFSSKHCIYVSRCRLRSARIEPQAIRGTLSTLAAAVKVISQDGSIPDDGLNLLIDQAKKDVKATRDNPLSEIADFTILREVRKEMGLH